MIDLNKKLTINEIFYSIQGESYLAGLPFVFVRLTGCHQRCSYCDTEYAFYEGQKMALQDIFDKIESYNCPRVLMTGGEPLLQDNCIPFMEFLLSKGYQVNIETSGNRSLQKVPKAVVKIMDLKTPGSNEAHRNTYENLKYLDQKDEVKFVVTDQADIEWAMQTIHKHNIDQICHVSVSPTKAQLHPAIAEAILTSKKTIRQQMQFHKVIWPGVEKGV